MSCLCYAQPSSQTFWKPLSYVDRVPYFPLPTKTTFQTPNANMATFIVLRCPVRLSPFRSQPSQKLTNLTNDLPTLKLMIIMDPKLTDDAISSTIRRAIIRLHPHCI